MEISLWTGIVAPAGTPPEIVERLQDVIEDTIELPGVRAAMDAISVDAHSSTSKQFSVLSRFTAFLAIDRSEVANKGGILRQLVQPVESPAGWERERHHGSRSHQVSRRVGPFERQGIAVGIG